MMAGAVGYDSLGLEPFDPRSFVFRPPDAIQIICNCGTIQLKVTWTEHVCYLRKSTAYDRCPSLLQEHKAYPYSFQAVFVAVPSTSIEGEPAQAS